MKAVKRGRFALLTLAGAGALALFSPFGSPARAYDYNHPCLEDGHPPTHTPLSVFPGTSSDLWLLTDTGEWGQVGVCVSPFGGLGVITGVGVGGDFYGGEGNMTGVLVSPEACADVYPVIGPDAICERGGVTGAEANLSGNTHVCAADICVFPT